MDKRLRIACYGASNTYGYDPRSYLGDRYEADARWPECLAALTGCTVLNWGENGRELPHSPQEYAALHQLLTAVAPVDLLVIDLGINDLLRGYPPSAQRVAERLEGLLLWLGRKHPTLRPLVLTPSGLDIPDGRRMAAFSALAPAFAEVGRRLQVPVLCTTAWALPLSYDGIHLSEEGQRQLARLLCNSLRESIL